MSQLPSRRRRCDTRNPNLRRSPTLPSIRHYPEGSSDSVSLPDLNLIPQLDSCPDIDLLSDTLDPCFHHHDCTLDLGFTSTGHLGFCSFTESEEEDVASGFGCRFQLRSDFGQHNLHPEGLRVSAIDSDSDSEDFVHALDSLFDDAESEESYLGLGRVDFDLRLSGTDSESIIDPQVQREEIIIEANEISSMSTGMDSPFSEFEFGSGLRNLEDFDVDDDYMAVLGIVQVQEDGVNDFEQLLENVGALRGHCPAARRVVDELPVVEMGKLKNGVCPICIEEIAGGEKLTMLPCKHYYHGECLLPWLGERNTCPVCRYELPTEEEDEKSRWVPEPGAASRVDEGEDDGGLPWDSPGFADI